MTREMLQYRHDVPFAMFLNECGSVFDHGIDIAPIASTEPTDDWVLRVSVEIHDRPKICVETERRKGFGYSPVNRVCRRDRTAGHFRGGRRTFSADIRTKPVDGAAFFVDRDKRFLLASAGSDAVPEAPPPCDAVMVIVLAGAGGAPTK